MDPQPLTASVIGCGTGGRLSLEALSASPHFRIVAATDLRPEVRAFLEREFPGLRTFGSHREMLAHCPIDVVCVSTLAEQIRSGTPDYRLPESSQTALEICEAAFLSWQHRCQVRFPLSSFVPPSPSDWQPGKAYSGVGGGRDGRKLQEQ